MNKNNRIKILVIFIVIIVSGYFFSNFIIGDDRFKKIKSILTVEQKFIIKKFIFPYKVISEQEKLIENLKKTEGKKAVKKLEPSLAELELYIKSSGKDIRTTESTVNLSNNSILKKYKLDSGFVAGINNPFPGSGYIDFFEGNIFVVSARGVLAYKSNLTNLNENFKQIKNNINDFIGLDQFKKYKTIALRDLTVIKNKMYISYTEEVKEDCFNAAIISGNINYEKINFKKIFSDEKCLNSASAQSGGRVVEFSDNEILLSVGDYGNEALPQIKNNIHGKILKINTTSGNYNIVSMGHRNPQGLYFDKENNFILETEHGPKGGDEINLIEVKKFDEDTIQNFGWAIASAGEHYGGRVPRNKERYEKFPLYKSHTEHGFIEPLKSFVPAIAISEIVKIEDNRYVVSSMGSDRPGDKSLYYFELNDKKITNLEQIKVFERIRDLKFKDSKLYMFMEDTASIGVINLN